MSHSFHCVHVHFVWATWDRLPLITSDIEKRVYGAIRAKCEELKCPVLAIGGIENHVHLLVKLHPTVAQSLLARDVKGASSHLVTHILRPGEFFKWQGSYASFAVEPERLPQVVAYIENQKEHHASGSEWDVLEKIEDEEWSQAA
jgi:putative transposase